MTEPEKKYEINQKFTEFVNNPEEQKVIHEAIKDFVRRNFSHVKDIKLGQPASINLYTFLININIRYTFQSFFKEHIQDGKILVNGKKPVSINMALYSGDIVMVCDKEYVI